MEAPEGQPEMTGKCAAIDDRDVIQADPPLNDYLLESETTKNDQLPTNDTTKTVADYCNQESETSLLDYVPCLVCCLPCIPIKQEVSDEGGDNTTVNMPMEAFWEAFRLRRIKRVCWQQCEITPFCFDCQDELMRLHKLQINLHELESCIESTTKQIKQKLECSEMHFQSENIYKVDWRYYRIRSSILGQAFCSHFGAKEPKQRGRPKVKVDCDETGENKTTSDISLAPTVSVRVVDDEDANDHHKYKTRTRSSARISCASKGISLEGQSYVKVEAHDSGEGDDSLTPEQSQFDTTSKPNKSRKSIKAPVSRKEKSKVGKPQRKRSSQIRKKVVQNPTRDEDETDSANTYSRKTRKVEMEVDLDYNPSRDEEDFDNGNDDVDEDDDEVKGRGWSKSAQKFVEDPKTGDCEYYKIKFKKLAHDCFECQTCHHTISNHRRIKSHTIRWHTDKFLCNQCEFRAADRCKLQVHIRQKHEGVRPKKRIYECPICGKPCAKRTTLMCHKVTHYSEEDKREAEAKGESIMTWKTFKGGKNNQCDQCGKVFSSKAELRKHQQNKHQMPIGDSNNGPVVNSINQQVCPVCGKSVSIDHMRKHMKWYHSPPEELETIRRFVCTVCNKRFLNSASLNHHKVVHTGIRPFQCEMCPRQFALKVQMNRHMRTHLNVRPFQCTHCPSAFISKHQLKRHIGIYHEEGSNPKRKTFVRGPVMRLVPRKTDCAEDGPETPELTTSRPTDAAKGFMI